MRPGVIGLLIALLTTVALEGCLHSAQQAHEESKRILHEFDSINNTLSAYTVDTTGDALHHQSDSMLRHRNDSIIHWLDSVKREDAAE